MMPQRGRCLGWPRGRKQHQPPAATCNCIKLHSLIFYPLVRPELGEPCLCGFFEIVKRSCSWPGDSARGLGLAAFGLEWFRDMEELRHKRQVVVPHFLGKDKCLWSSPLQRRTHKSKLLPSAPHASSVHLPSSSSALLCSSEAVSSARDLS